MNKLGRSYTDVKGNMKPFRADLDWSKRQDQRCLSGEGYIKTLFDTPGMQLIVPIAWIVFQIKTKDANKSWAARVSEEVSRSRDVAA